MSDEELERKHGSFACNIAQTGDALTLLQSLPDGCSPLVFFDPQFRAVLDKLAFGNERARQKGRAQLPAMTEQYIEAVCRQCARVLRPSGYLMKWADTFSLCEAHHLRLADVLKCVDLIAWDNERMGMGKRSRRRGDYLLVLQKPPITASNWRDHTIPSRWPEKVDRKLHPHVKPAGLIKGLIGAVTEPEDLIIDPAAGSFVVMHMALHMGREFVGCDLAYGGAQPDDNTVDSETRGTTKLPADAKDAPQAPDWRPRVSFHGQRDLFSVGDASDSSPRSEW